MHRTTLATVARHEASRQFVKFCIIGATSAVIDIGVFLALVHVGWNPMLARTLSVSLAVINGFVWNSRWTFKGHGASAQHHQFIMFALVNVVGLGLNVGIMTGVFLALAGRAPIPHEPRKPDLYAGLSVAIVLVSLWNFLANKYWTFAGVREEEVTQ